MIETAFHGAFTPNVFTQLMENLTWQLAVLPADSLWEVIHGC